MNKYIQGFIDELRIAIKTNIYIYKVYKYYLKMRKPLKNASEYEKIITVFDLLIWF